jgi:hypothetical protein
VSSWSFSFVDEWIPIVLGMSVILHAAQTKISVHAGARTFVFWTAAPIFALPTALAMSVASAIRPPAELSRVASTAALSWCRK